MKRWMLGLAGLLVLTPGAFCQDPQDRQTLDASLGWGIDRDSGKIAVDAYLVYFYDPETRVLVVNGSAFDEAIVDAGAEVQQDGSWRMPDGATLKPLLGEVAIFAGDEPEELRTTLRDFPQTSVSRVELSGKASASAERVKWFKRCNRCTGCPSGCSNQDLWPGGNFKTCGAGGFFTRCKEWWGPEYCDPVLHFACAGCTGGLLETYSIHFWGCAPDC